MDREKTLHEYMMSNAYKGIDKWIHYFDIYDRHFTRFRHKEPVMMEIGVQAGGSLRMWRNYFGPGAKIIGIDIDPECKNHEEENIEIFIGSQDDGALMSRVLDKYGPMDIVLDDGSHMMNHMRASFELLYSRMSPFGIYVVEDLHTCYWEEYGGGLQRPESFIEFVKEKIDELNASHSRGALQVSEFTRSTDAICCYDSVTVFERRPQGRRQCLRTGGMSEG